MLAGQSGFAQCSSGCGKQFRNQGRAARQRLRSWSSPKDPAIYDRSVLSETLPSLRNRRGVTPFARGACVGVLRARIGQTGESFKCFLPGAAGCRTYRRAPACSGIFEKALRSWVWHRRRSGTAGAPAGAGAPVIVCAADCGRRAGFLPPAQPHRKSCSAIAPAHVPGASGNPGSGWSHCGATGSKRALRPAG